MTTPPALSPEVLNRLLIGRELLRSFGPLLTPQSDALTVARGIVTSQDASELISSAIAEHLRVQPKDRAGLPEYIESIEKATKTAFPGKSFFNLLNRARISFKHHGALPNVSDFHQVLGRVQDHLDQAAANYLGITLDALDLSLLISDLEVRRLYTSALELARTKKYREALEGIARALQEADRVFPMYIPVGKTDPETALELTAYGVDPGTFIRMEQFLPEFGIEDLRWDVRMHGHPGNWTKQNVEFCLSTFLDLVLKLQHATFHPSAIEFMHVFDDVLTAKHDGVLIHSEPYNPLLYGHGRRQKFFGEMKAGQRIKGHLIPALQPENTYKWEKTSFELADTYVMQRAEIDTGDVVPEYTALIVRAEDVTWSYEEREGVRQYLSHIFESEENA